MPYVDPANYPAGIPEGAFHLDQDDEHDYRFPRTMDHDFLLYLAHRVLDQSTYWAVRENIRTNPRELSAAELAAGPMIMRDRRIRDLTAQAAALQAQLAAAPPPDMRALPSLKALLAAVRASPLVGLPAAFVRWADSVAPPWAFLFAEVVTMLPRAVRGHAWYHERFRGAYPKERRVVIPFLF